jgi:hypothetical protein
MEQKFTLFDLLKLPKVRLKQHYHFHKSLLSGLKKPKTKGCSSFEEKLRHVDA